MLNRLRIRDSNEDLVTASRRPGTKVIRNSLTLGLADILAPYSLTYYGETFDLHFLTFYCASCLLNDRRASLPGDLVNLSSIGATPYFTIFLSIALLSFDCHGD